ncbi:MAG: hypothetical protein DMG02_08355 [Acidobacteria bacterium]|nr:MAG: hypothetical protein DMG02_08355 [Acidobacteriota bacterium]
MREAVNTAGPVSTSSSTASNRPRLARSGAATSPTSITTRLSLSGYLASGQHGASSVRARAQANIASASSEPCKRLDIRLSPLALMTYSHP